jgi:hypothetical protein
MNQTLVAMVLGAATILLSGCGPLFFVDDTATTYVSRKGPPSEIMRWASRDSRTATELHHALQVLGWNAVAESPERAHDAADGIAHIIERLLESSYRRIEREEAISLARYGISRAGGLTGANAPVYHPHVTRKFFELRAIVECEPELLEAWESTARERGIDRATDP